MNHSPRSGASLPGSQAFELYRRLLPFGMHGDAHRVAFEAAWEGVPYVVAAESAGYSHDYIRRAGAELLKGLSDSLGFEVTKKDLRALLGGMWSRSTLDESSAPPTPGGPIPLDSPFYVEPACLADAKRELRRPGALVRLRSATHTGKTSFLLRLRAFAEEQGWTCVPLDLLKIDHADLRSLDSFLRTCARLIEHTLGLQGAVDKYFLPDVGPKVSTALFLTHHVLDRSETPTLILLDNLDRIFERPEIAVDFSTFIRSWFEEARVNTVAARLRGVLSHAAETELPLDINRSPFNVGLTLTLPDLLAEDVVRLASLYGLDWRISPARRFAEDLLGFTGGHPSLVHRALAWLAATTPPETVPSLLQTATTPGGLFAPELREVRQLFERRPTLAECFSKVLAGNPTEMGRNLHLLEGMGVVRFSRGVPVLRGTLWRALLPEAGALP